MIDIHGRGVTARGTNPRAVIAKTVPSGGKIKSCVARCSIKIYSVERRNPAAKAPSSLLP